MDTALWIIAGILAAVFAMAGLMKLVQPKEKLASATPYVEDFSAGQVKAIGAVEVLGAIGLILPAVVDVAPILVPTAATGLAITMLLAGVVHVRRGEQSNLPVNAVLFALAAFVAVMRFGPNAF